MGKRRDLPGDGQGVSSGGEGLPSHEKAAQTEAAGEAQGAERAIHSICVIRAVMMYDLDMPYEDQGFLMSIVENIYEECYHRQIKPFSMMCTEQNFREVVAYAIGEKHDGVVIIGTEMREEDVEFLGQLDTHGKPLIVFGNGMMNTNVSCINLANQNESYMAVRYLYDIGYRAIGYLRSSIPEWGFLQREKGYDRAVRHLGMESVLKLQLPSMITYAYQEMKEWLLSDPELPRAFFADNDNTALGAMRALQEKGYRIPEDISLIGMDGIALSAFSAKPLTTIHISRSQIAKMAVLYVTEFPTGDAVRIYCRGKLVVRESTRQFDAETEAKFVCIKG